MSAYDRLDLFSASSHIPVDTADSQPAKASSRQASGSGSGSFNESVAGVLRRNQACLQCRKRKLKCDASRPHCATCIRSHRHLLRTSPKSNPVLCCDYDDAGQPVAESGSGAHEEVENRSLSIGHEGGSGDSTSPPLRDDEGQAKVATGGGVKKKRKATGEPRRKKTDEEFEEERDRLTKQIEDLRSQLAEKPNNPQPEKKGPLSWSGSSLFTSNQDQAVPSPNTFLNLFTSSNVPPASTNVEQESQMWGTIATGTSASTQPSHEVDSPTAHVDRLLSLGSRTDVSSFMSDSSSKGADSRKSSFPIDSIPGSVMGGESSTGYNFLSPRELFSFSPGDSTQWSKPSTAAKDSTDCFTAFKVGWQETTKYSGMEGMGPVNAAAFMSRSQPAGMGNMADPGVIGVPGETEISMDGLQSGLDAAMQQQLLLDLFWPGWPSKLPEPNVVNDLVDAFFDLVPNLPRVLHRARFLARMALPPTHSNFPHPSLIHAVCAAATSWCSPDLYNKSTRDAQWAYEDLGLGTFGCLPNEAAKGPGGDFALRQTVFAKEAIQDGLNTGNRLFDVVRAMIILCRVFMDDTRMLECWAYSGLVARMLIPLGLNVRSAALSLKTTMLPPPVDALEREERRAAVWMAFYHDTIPSATSGWGTSISLDELSVALPVSAIEFDIGAEDMEPNPQDLESLDLYLKHPVLDPFVMLIKAASLLNRANKFVRKWKNRHLRPNDDMDGMDRPEFKEIANAIACFQMSFPPSLRNICHFDSRRRLSNDLIAANMIPHAASISLYEPFADVHDPNDQATRRLVTATQGIVSIIQQLAGVAGGQLEQFTYLMHASASVCLITSSRSSLLLMRHAMSVGDAEGARSHRMNCDVAQLAISQFGSKSKIAQHHAKIMEHFSDLASNPTFEKMKLHYPNHPRGHLAELRPDSDFGLCIENALNIKRGYWRIPSFATAAPATEAKPDTNWKPAESTRLPQSRMYGESAGAQTDATSSGISPFGSTPESSSTSNHPNTGGSLSSASGGGREIFMETPPEPTHADEMSQNLEFWNDHFAQITSENTQDLHTLTPAVSDSAPLIQEWCRVPAPVPTSLPLSDMTLGREGGEVLGMDTDVLKHMGGYETGMWIKSNQR